MQIADVNAGLLACSAILAALLSRERTGRGSVIDQPLITGPLPLLAWPLADRVAGGGGVTDEQQLLTGGCAAYRLYTCADGAKLAVGALEPKFWVEFVEMLGLTGIEGAGLDTGPEGKRAAGRVEQRLATRPREHWLEQARQRGLPVTAVHDLTDAVDDPVLVATGLVPGSTCGPFLPSLGKLPERPAPRLGQHTDRLIEEFGLD